MYNVDLLSRRASKFLSVSRKLCQRRSNFPTLRLFEGERGTRYHSKRASIGPPAKRHSNGVSLACQWRLNIKCSRDNFGIFRGSWTVLLRNPMLLRIIRRGSGSPPPPPLDPRMYMFDQTKCIVSTSCTRPQTETLTNSSRREFPTVINWTCPFPF